jgi:hypothetical protein
MRGVVRLEELKICRGFKWARKMDELNYNGGWRDHMRFVKYCDKEYILSQPHNLGVKGTLDLIEFCNKYGLAFFIKGHTEYEGSDRTISIFVYPKEIGGDV